MKRLCISIAVMVLASCQLDRRQEINCKYRGAIVIEKREYGETFRTVNYDLKYQGEIIYVEPYQIDYDYEVGDTINGPCR